ncbi:MAG TPA: stage II sporulation protein M, partial [Chryseosolibacter sp.]|nr:stage II sporulation protein M [Chryseosolibacter sp.]
FFFIERGLLAESALTIWLHGTLEISSIILAGGAGLTLGSGLLFPGTYSRLQAFQITAVRSLKLMLGIAPIFVLAGLIESFLTRYTDVPDVLRLFLILCSAFFILGYFVYYPWMKSRKGFDHPLEAEKLPASDLSPLTVTRIKNNGEIIKDAFAFYKKSFSSLFRWIALVTLLMCTAEFFLPEERSPLDLGFEPILYLLSNMYYGMKTNSLTYLAINAIGCSLIVYRVFMLIQRELFPSRKLLNDVGTFLQMIMPVALVYALLYWLDQWGVVLVAVTASLFLLMCFVQFFERPIILESITTTIRLCAGNFGQVMGLHFILLMMSFSFLLILSAPLLYMTTSILQWNFAETDVWSQNIIRFVEIFLKLLSLNLVIPVFASSLAFLYFSLREIYTAENLKLSIAQVGNKNVKGRI